MPDPDDSVSRPAAYLVAGTVLDAFSTPAMLSPLVVVVASAADTNGPVSVSTIVPVTA